MKKPVVPKPIFPVGHRFSISGEYPHQYNQHIPQPGKILDIALQYAPPHTNTVKIDRRGLRVSQG